MASLLTACSQEELVPNVTGGAVEANRPIVGNVVFGEGNAETRYNYELGEMDADEKMGIYLMDEFRGGIYNTYVGELNDANKTAFKWQESWWQMYNMVNYVQSNYTYNRQPDKSFRNESAQLVEGNYMAMVPLNENITNRRDLWYPIHAEVDLAPKAGEKNYFVGRRNQFFLGYSQLYRNAGAEDKTLTINPYLKGILTYAKFNIENAAANQFIVEKLVFSDPEGRALPTIAYIKPAEETQAADNTWPTWLNTTAQNCVKTQYDECGYLVGTLWNKDWWNQTVARSLVQYETPAGRVPYVHKADELEALKDVAYEYVFKFPESGEYSGVLLAGDEAGGADNRTLTVSLALPPFETVDGKEFEWTDLEVEVHGKMYDPNMPIIEKVNGKWVATGKGGWRPGIVKEIGNDDGEVNGTFGLNNMKLFTTDKPMVIPEATVKLDDEYFAQQQAIRTSNTADLINLMNACLTNPQTTENIVFDVTGYGDGLEITQEIVDMMDTYEEQHDVTVEMNFFGDAPIVLMAENIIERFKYHYVDVVLNANQTVSGKNITGVATLTNNAKLTIDGKDVDAVQIINSEDKTLKKVIFETKNKVNIKTGSLINYGRAVFGGEVKITDADADDDENAGATVHNLNTMEINGTLTVSNNLVNANDCLTCHDNVAKLTNNGTLEINNNFYNGYGDKGGIFENNANAAFKVVSGEPAEAKLINASGAVINNEGNGTVNILDNKGVINVKAGKVTVNHAIVESDGGYGENAGNVNVTDGAEFIKDIYNYAGFETHKYSFTLRVNNDEPKAAATDHSGELAKARKTSWNNVVNSNFDLTAGSISAVAKELKELNALEKNGVEQQTLKADGQVIRKGAAAIELTFDGTMELTQTANSDEAKWIEMTEADASALNEIVAAGIEDLTLNNVGINSITPEMNLSVDVLTVKNSMQKPISIEGVDGTSGKLIAVNYFDYSGVSYSGDLTTGGVLNFVINNGYVYVNQIVGEGSTDHVGHIVGNLKWYKGNGNLEAGTSVTGSRAHWNPANQMWHTNDEKHWVDR